MDKMDYFTMLAMVACMGLAVATFAILPPTAPGDVVPAFLFSMSTWITVHLVWIPSAIVIHLCSLFGVLGPRAYLSYGMTVFHWVASGACVSTACAAAGVITEETFCSGSSPATCRRYYISTGLAILLGLLNTTVAVVVNQTRLTHGPHPLAVAGQYH